MKCKQDKDNGKESIEKLNTDSELQVIKNFNSKEISSVSKFLWTKMKQSAVSHFHSKTKKAKDNNQSKAKEATCN